MKILWICNIVLPELSNVFGFKKQNVGGWLTGMWEELKKTEYELAICVPIRNKLRIKDGCYNNYKYYSFLTVSNESNTTIDNQRERFKEIINIFRPDIIHIWGTEYEHSLAMVEAAKECQLLDSVVVNIQGLLTYYEKVFDIGIPKYILNYKDVNGNSIFDDKQRFKNGAALELNTIKNVNNCIGRTDWDKACVKQVNNKINYYYCGEILRKGFYDSLKWDVMKCNKHSVFLSQANYPIKGLHLILEELSQLKEQYTDLTIRIAGSNLMESSTPYSVFIKKEIQKYKLNETICFLGDLSEEQMIEQYLSANVFLSPSLIENSSNSICEAMMLGVPVVASDVGGTASLITNKVTGYLYPLMEPNIMRYYISEVFDNKEKTKKISKKSIKKAEHYNNRKQAVENLVGIYNEIYFAQVKRNTSYGQYCKG